MAKKDNRSINKIAYGLLNKARAGRSSSEDPISRSQLKYHIINTRAQLLRQDEEKNRRLDRITEQSLGCLDMELVDEADECCEGISTDCFILRSKKQIPDVVRLRYRDGITFIGSVDGRRRFPIETPQRARILSHRPYSGSKPRSFIYRNYVYLTNSTMIDKINARVIAADPKQVANFNNCDGSKCYTDDDPFPVPDDMIPRIENIVWQQVLQPMLSTVQDTQLDLQQQRTVPNDTEG